MSPKKRAKKGKRGGAQLSGNPQRRAEQVAEREARQPVSGESAEWPPLSGDLGPDLGWDAEYPGLGPLGPSDSLAPVADAPRPGWAETHRRVLDRVHEVEIPEDPMAIDSLTCELVGGVFWDAIQAADEKLDELLDAEFDRLSSQDELQIDFQTFDELSGFDAKPIEWLNALADAAAREITEAPEGSPWEGAWLLLRGMTAWANYDPESESIDPVEAVSAATRRAGEALVGDGRLPRFSDPWAQLRPRPTGWPLVLHDAYGSRLALLAPFAYGEERREPHWYCWDIDQCCTDNVVGAGLFPSMEAAAAEWRSTVGASAPADAEPRPCTAYEAVALLSIPVDNHLLTGLRTGDEPRELVVEQYRSAGRAEEVFLQFRERLEVTPQPAPDRGIEAFRDWYAERNGDKPDFAAIETLAEEWGPPHSAPPLFHTCSPHRIRYAGAIIGDSYEPESVPAILALLPEWVEWCLERTGVAGEPADASRAEARRIADQAADGVKEPDAGAPFRVQEL